MALHLIITGLLQLLNSEILSDFLNFTVQLLNFGVLLSYPINFFIYCRMSRAFRDAFTQLLCPSINRSRVERLSSATIQLNIKSLNNIKNINSNDKNNDHFELNNTNTAMKNVDIEIVPTSTVILNATTAETPMSTTPSLTPRHSSIDEKKSSIASLGKQRVVFRDEISTSTNTKFTDL